MIQRAAPIGYRHCPILETHFYAADRNRYAVETPAQRTYYAWGGASVLEEYTEPLAGNTPTYSKSYIYAGSRLLSTYTNNNGTETLQLQHPDRLGTKLVTNPQAATQFEQATLPFGTSLDAETSGTTNQRFTSYDRSTVASLDYAVNRSYSSGQGRFTSVDPAQDGSNLYAYAGNDPINNVDPSGLNAAPYDPMGISYYVDGMLVDGRTAMGYLNSGAGYVDSSNVSGFDVIDIFERKDIGDHRQADRRVGQIFIIFGFSEEQFKQINDQIVYMQNSEECAKAFKNAGLTTVNEMINNGGLIIVNRNALTKENDSKWYGNESIRNGILGKFDEVVKRGGITADVTPEQPINGRYYSALSNVYAFDGSVDSIPRVITHSIMHAGGANGNGAKISETIYTEDGAINVARNPAHDLEWMNYRSNRKEQYTGVYDGIMDACTPKK